MSWRGYVSRSVRNVRFIVDNAQMDKGGSCFGVRQWYESNLATMAEVNPHFTFMLRGFDFAEPSLLISFNDGTARIEPLAHKTPTDIDAYLRQAVVDAVKKNRDEIRETATLPHIER
ncbi:hypothetical protein FNF27_05571 [Cafeteria roenbergensis]|uniref:Ribosomal protein/NADH dehydrogenase domain-containing protein n=1 Tax=Cafeteria roenbergensis TaxID=33653 RepID=A0A5A8DLH8_CAFRO|nr:hypothetical protein FNF29_06110 [Cafeteria roenbergensis]KAA0164681.1 hypothetical protein FNF28_03742 [Cafeteria roenbergensis]KAA0168608.1 hypothetical protein FNF31_00488 [Cafeteria roenbergensis]KAA0172934.1 hypothetical protein FNF27_05571 [Cafeteria roenbergensis]|eukprot:KAA0149223.1 hypothetical protein FNF29_06110 [Cafeteria roenbergensis]